MQRKSKARDAFVSGSAESSKLVHSNPQLCEQGHRTNRIDSLDELLAVAGKAGAQTLLIATVVIFSSSASADSALSSGTVRAVICVTLALAVYNSVTLFLGRLSQSQVERFERERETWEFDNFAEGEKREMVDLYISKGVTKTDAVRAIELLAKREYREAFVDLMMVEELGILPAPRRIEAVRESGVSLCASVTGGLLTLVPHLLGLPVHINRTVPSTGFVAFAFGVMISRSNLDSALKGGLITMSLVSSILYVASIL